MNNTVSKSHKSLKIGLILSGLLALTAGFQNCSEVGFSKIEDNSSLSCAPGETEDLNGNCVTMQPTPGIVLPTPQTVVTTKTIAAPSSKVDILLVVDNSGSMEDDNNQLAAKFAGFVAFLNNQGLDWQACYTTTDVSNDGARGEAQYWLNGNGTSTDLRVLKKDSFTGVKLNEVFSASIGQFDGGGSGNEQGISALNRALDHASNVDCFRDDAVLTTIVISDEDERSCGGRSDLPDETTLVPNRSASSYSNSCQALSDLNSPEKVLEKVNTKFNNNNKIFLAHSLVIKENDAVCWHAQDAESHAYYGMVYEHLTQLTGGIFGDICSADYTLELDTMAENITNSLSAMVLDCAPYQDQVAVTYQFPANGGPAQNPAASISGNKLIFTPAVPAGTVVTATYKCLLP